jgi:phenylpyruvate tautomerase PptA (4-oxalocrotonate tautomerase family)
MPILEVALALGTDEALPSDLAQRVADAAGRYFGAAPGTVWVTVHGLTADRYAENATPAQATPRPAFVRLLQAAPADPAHRADQAAALTAALAPALGRDPAEVHLLFEPAAAGRIAFGGRLRR